MICTCGATVEPVYKNEGCCENCWAYKHRKQSRFNRAWANNSNGRSDSQDACFGRPDAVIVKQIRLLLLEK